MKITGVVRSAEEITGIKDLQAFFGTNYYYTTDMNSMAGQRIEIAPYNGDVCLSASDYNGAGYNWQAGWLKDISKEVDWSKVPVDAKVKIKTLDKRLYFAKYENYIIHTWEDGQTSWSSPHGRTMLWGINLYEVELVED